MKALNLGLLSLAAVALAACSSTGDEQTNKQFYYTAGAVKVRSLEVPPDLTSPVGNDRYSIPGNNEEGIRFSDFSRGGAKTGGAVSAETRTVRLMRSGNQRWLEVNDKAENIWPLVKAFWQENGLTIKTDNQQTGLIETDWAENRAKVSMQGMDNVLGGALEGLYSPPERDQYRTLLERGRDGKVTEITIQHSGQHQVQSSRQMAYRWVDRPADAELESTMLQLLVAKLNASSAAVTSVQAPPAALQPAVKLQTRADGSKSILLSEPFDKSWRKVTLALEQSGIALEDKDRSKGIFFLRAAKNADKDAPNQVNVLESAAGCEVTAGNGKGASTPDALRIIDTLYQNLVKQQL